MASLQTVRQFLQTHKALAEQQTNIACATRPTGQVSLSGVGRLGADCPNRLRHLHFTRTPAKKKT